MKSKRRVRKKSRRIIILNLILIGIAIPCAALYLFVQNRAKDHGPSMLFTQKSREKEPTELLEEYMGYLSNQAYDKMYAMLDVEVSGGITLEEFTSRNLAIYEGIQMQNMVIEDVSYSEADQTVSYQTSFDTSAGKISFENDALFVEDDGQYLLAWSDALIFPDLECTDKVRVSTAMAKRGRILDRNGRILAGKGTAASVGIVPGKLKHKKNSISKIAELLEIEPKAVKKKLSAKWVKDDSFVPIKTIPQVKEIDLMTLEPTQEALEEKKRQDLLLEIPGVMISEVEIREYPLGQAASHLTGYIQNVTAEDLEEHVGEGYTANSMIGRSGAEWLFEKELKGHDGCKIYITDAGGSIKKELADIPVEHGQDLKLTIDAGLQSLLYEQFKGDKSCSAAIHPYTGEVLALVSTPSYDSNDFIMGMSSEKWESLNEDENKPLYNRFRQTWCPGSTFKPVIAAIGLETNRIDPMEDFGNEGSSWQKSASWGGYYVTTLHPSSPANMENALIYSDNIYFAKAALKIGADRLEKYLAKLGFGQAVPFEMRAASAQFSNEDHINTEIQLADSGYGQGQILINPLHMACIYTAFCNDGKILKPHLLFETDAAAEYWIPDAFSADTADRVLEGIKKVVNDPNGTGYGLHRDDILLAGKTGTAEIKASKEDSSGTELGWMTVFTAEKGTERPILIVSMVEDVKGRGGSGYVVEKEKQILEEWFAKQY